MIEGSAMTGGCPQNSGGRHVFIRRGVACVMCGEAYVKGLPAVGDHAQKRSPGPNDRPMTKVASLFLRDGDECHYCRCPLRPRGGRRILPRFLGHRLAALAATIDHVVPVVAGGSNSPSNLVLSCEFCNRWKAAMSEAEFRASPAFIGQARKVERLKRERAAVQRCVS